MKIIKKIKKKFKKHKSIIPTEPLEIKSTIIPTEHFRARIIIPNNLFLEENPEVKENEARNLLLREIEKNIKDRLVIKERHRNYGEPFIFETDIFIGF